MKTFHIVHLDDHKLFADAIKKLISDEWPTAEVFHFDVEKQALEFIETCLRVGQKIDLVITDYSHGVRNGIEFAKDVKKLKMALGQDFPVILYTLKSPDKKIDFALSSKTIDDYISKAAEKNELINELGEFLGMR